MGDVNQDKRLGELVDAIARLIATALREHTFGQEILEACRNGDVSFNLVYSEQHGIIHLSGTVLADGSRFPILTIEGRPLDKRLLN